MTARDPYVEMSRDGRKFILNTAGGVVAAGAAYVLYIANDAGQRDIWIPHVHATASAAVTIGLHTVTGTAAGGSAPSALASRIGGTAMADVTTRLHTGITGLTIGSVYANTRRAAGSDADLVHPEHGLILPASTAIAIHTSGAATIAAEIHLIRL